MKLEAPLLELVEECETNCVSGCCGLNAYNFSPIFIASFIIREKDIVNALKEQMKTLSINYGEKGSSGRGVEIEDMNESLSGKAVDALSNELLTNLNLAVKLIEDSESNRYKNA